MKRGIGWLALSLLSACSGPTFRYEAAIPNSNTPDPPGSLRFSLQRLSILIDKPSNTSTSADDSTTNTKSKPSNTSTVTDSTTANKNSGAVVDACKGLNLTDENYNKCLASINPVASSIPDIPNGRFIAIPNNSFLQKTLGATQISGTTVSGTNYLYKQVTINYSSNVKNIITSGSTGAATGFALGGPLGLGVGAGAGVAMGLFLPAVAAPPTAAPPPPPPQTTGDITPFVCPEERPLVIWKDLKPEGQIALGLPVVLEPSSLPDFPATTESQNFPPTTESQSSVCWHPVPNALRGAGSGPDLQNFGTPNASTMGREPEIGDGWFYRIYFPDDERTLPGAADNTKIRSNLIPNMPNDQFPSSYCRPNAYLEIAWWEELVKGSTGKAVSYSIASIPDPNYFQVVNVPYTGNINFNPICGASSSSGNGPDYTGTWDALTQAINTTQSQVQKANSASAK